MKENKPLPTHPGEDFPSLGGPTRGALGANFVKAEEKLFKQKTVPSQWSQSNDLATKKPENDIKEASNSTPKDFPVLKSKKPPPGFANNSSKLSKPPPPPGFKKLQLNHKYTPPSNFQERNSALITTITGLIGGKSLEFKTFKEISGQFRRGHLTPDAYFSQCRGLVSKGHFDTFFRAVGAVTRHRHARRAARALPAAWGGSSCQPATMSHLCSGLPSGRRE